MAAILTPVARLSYPHLAKAQQANSDDPTAKDKFSATFVFSSKDDLKALEAEARAAAIEFFGEKKGKALQLFGGKGSAFRTDNADKYPDIEGAITIGARSDKRPGMVYRHADPVTVTAENPKGKPANVPQGDIEEVFYPGALVRGHIKPYGYDKKGNKGIGWALNNVQKYGEAERLDSRVKAEDAFEADNDMSTVPDELKDIA